MATLYIAEFDKLAILRGVAAPIALGAPVAEQTVSIGGSSTQSSAVNVATRFVRLHTDSVCSIAIGTDPTATSSKMRMAADATEYFAVPPSGKIAVITNT